MKNFIDSQIEAVRKNYPILTREEEVELVERVKQGDMKARDVLFFTAMGLIRTEVKQIHINGVDYEDLMQDAYEIVCSKIKDFNPAKGTRFSTFIWPWIWQGLMNRNLAIKNRDYLFSRQVSKAQEYLTSVYDRIPFDSEIAEYLHMDYSQFKKKMNRIIYSGTVSLDAPISSSSTGEEGGSFKEFIEDTVNISPEDRIMHEECDRVYRESINRLPEKERKVFIACHGNSLANIETSKSYHMVGADIGLSHEGVRGIDKRAKEKVRRYLINEGILAA